MSRNQHLPEDYELVTIIQPTALEEGPVYRRIFGNDCYIEKQGKNIAVYKKGKTTI